MISQFAKSIAIFLLAIFLLVASCSTLPRSYIETSYRNSELMLQNLVEYINADTTLPDYQKKIRIYAVEQWRTLLKKAYDLNRPDDLEKINNEIHLLSFFVGSKKHD